MRPPIACAAVTAASVNGISIEYDVHGDDDGEPLLLVMGLGGQLIAWPLEFVERFVARGFRVIRFDNRDIGLSTQDAHAAADAPPDDDRDARRRVGRSPTTRSTTWPTTQPACSTPSASSGRTSSACRWAG